MLLNRPPGAVRPQDHVGDTSLREATRRGKASAEALALLIDAWPRPQAPGDEAPEGAVELLLTLDEK
jgi:hypothetical protein